jgi:hypothetical protein
MTAVLISLWLVCGILSATVPNAKQRSGTRWSFIRLLTSMLDVMLLIGCVALLAILLSALG